MKEVETRLNSIGSTINAETGKIIDPGPAGFNKDNAREMALRSHEKRRQNAIEAAKKGILQGLSNQEILDVGVWGGMSAIIAAQTELALDISKGNASTQAAKFVLEQADMIVRPEEEQTAAVKISLNEDAAATLASLLMDKKNSNKASDQIIDL